jgi:hypothetical protein
MRVAVGPTGSGTRKLALELLARNGIDESNTELLTLPPNEASERLIAGNIQAVMMLAAPDAPAVQRLLVSPDIKLMSISHADTYVALYPFLTTVVLPAGFADLPHERPPSDVKMIAIKMSLVVRRDLQSAVQYLLLEAATQIHSSPGVFQKAGQFPAAEGPDLPLSPDAQQFYKTGIPLLQRYLPLWLAVLIEQLAITLLPVGALAYPLLRGLPASITGECDDASRCSMENSNLSNFRLKMKVGTDFLHCQNSLDWSTVLVTSECHPHSLTSCMPCGRT